MRVRQADLDAFIEAGNTLAEPEAGDPDELRAELADALQGAREATASDIELAAALRTLAAKAKRLADALDKAR